MSKKELKVVRSLIINMDITILQADKGNHIMVLAEFRYKDKLNTFLEPRVYEPLAKHTTAKVERGVQKFFCEYETALLHGGEADSIQQQTSISVWSSDGSQT
jgi:hypothetical protein